MNKRIIAAILLTLAISAVVAITALAAYRTGVAQGVARAPEVAEQLRQRREQVPQPPRAPPAQPVPEGVPPANGGPRSAGPGPNGPPPFMQRGQVQQGPGGPPMMGPGMQMQRGFNQMPGVNRGMQMHRGPGFVSIVSLLLLGLITFLLWRTYARGAHRGPRWGGPDTQDHHGPPPWFEAWHHKLHEPQTPSTPEV